MIILIFIYMSYYINKETHGDFADVVERVRAELAKEGFGVLTEIDMQATLKKKLDVAYRPYVILGACNPPFAHRALELEEEIGTMLPCNVVVQERGGGTVEVAAVDPVASMTAVGNSELESIANEVRTKLVHAIENLS